MNTYGTHIDYCKCGTAVRMFNCVHDEPECDRCRARHTWIVCAILAVLIGGPIAWINYCDSKPHCQMATFPEGK